MVNKWICNLHSQIKLMLIAFSHNFKPSNFQGGSMKISIYLFCLFISTILLTITACKNIEDDNIELVKKYYEALNTKNNSLCDSIVTVNFKKSSNGNPEDGMGPEVLKNAIKYHSQNNSEYKYAVEDIFASENRVGVRWRWNSINIKTGQPKPINITAMSVFEIVDGKISRLWQAFDMGDFQRQLEK